MATKSITITRDTNSRNCWVVTWTGLANGDDGTPLRMPAASDRSWQVGGTFGAGGTVLCEGSNEGSNYVTLTDPQGNAISKTAAAIEQIEELTVYVRPRVSAGDGTTSINVTMLVRGQDY